MSHVSFPSSVRPAPHSYTLSVPEGWERSAAVNVTDLRATGGAPGRITLRTMFVPGDTALTALAVGLAGRVSAATPGVTVELARVGEVDGREVAIQSLRVAAAEGRAAGLVVLASMLVPAGDLAELFTLRLTCAEADREPHSAAFADVLKSFRVGPRLSA